ncbi:MAG: heavy metal translocating P-type ATPase, partial [Clostridia bacterium]|nr:heavy metal translocating P-type ATPase [Clostridia bacterium]
MLKSYTVTGMTCSACSSGIERTVIKLNGVNFVEVSLMGKSMKVDFNDAEISENEIFNAVKELGYGIYIEGDEPKIKERSKDKAFFIRFIISVCLLLPLMYVSMGHMFGAPLPKYINPHDGNAAWFSVVQAVFSLAIIIVNFAFFKNGMVALIKKVPNMDTLVALGSGVSFVYSIVLTVLNFCGAEHVHLHFESAAMILTLVTVGKWLEEKSKRKTGDEIEKLLKLAPDNVTIEENGEQKTVSIKAVKVGDILIVKQGEYIPVDGTVIFGHSFVDKSAITGESLPVEISVGDKVTSAALNKSGIIKVKAEKVGEQTTLSKIVKMVKEAGASKAPIQKFADKVAGIFVPVVTLISLLTFIIWLLIDGGFYPEHCVTYAISVLVVSCPCALGLATPVAIMTATGKAASLGILYKDAENLQKLCNVNTVLLDKTATLTEGKPKVCNFETFNFDKDLALKIACGIEKNSNHPLAKCIVEYACEGVEVSNFNYIIGKGATANYLNDVYYLGNEKLLSNVKLDNSVKKLSNEFSKSGKTVLYLAKNDILIAIFAVADTLKEGSKAAVRL